MYIQITTRCNMKCAHCGMACPKRGKDMTFETFKQAIGRYYNEHLTIGGGEPTIHPEFEKFVFYAVSQCEQVIIITNGKETDKAIALAKLSTLNSNLCCYLSQDPYHEPISQEVINIFKDKIWNTSNSLVNAGRCDFGDEGCICDRYPFVRPNGDVHQCGCSRSPKVGNVFTGFEALDKIDDDQWKCYKILKKT